MEAEVAVKSSAVLAPRRQPGLIVNLGKREDSIAQTKTCGETHCGSSAREWIDSDLGLCAELLVSLGRAEPRPGMTKRRPPAGKVAAGLAIMTGVCRRHRVQLRKRLGTLFPLSIAATTTKDKALRTCVRCFLYFCCLSLSGHH